MKDGSKPEAKLKGETKMFSELAPGRPARYAMTLDENACVDV